MAYKDADVVDSLKRVVDFYSIKGRSPKYVNVAKDTVTWSKYIRLSQIADKQVVVDKFKKDKGRDPAYVSILGFNIAYSYWHNLFETISVIKKDSGDEVFNYFVKIFGSVSTVDEALKKIKDKGYGHYFNDLYSNKQVIDNIKKGKGVNCTDSCQMMWHIAKTLGYDVKCVHVKCSGGDGHVRLQFKHSKHTGGNWINRDPACVLSKNGKAVTAIWCGGAKLIDTNPKWFIDTVNK